jgi:hypothetical protein
LTGARSDPRAPERLPDYHRDIVADRDRWHARQLLLMPIFVLCRNGAVVRPESSV